MVFRFTGFMLMLLFAPGLRAQWATAVQDHAFGNNQTTGQGAAYFPANVLGPPAQATPTVPASTPQEVLSLGRNGILTLAFDPPIADGPGADFAVFENAFLWGDNQVFDEWMIVSVSEDGNTFWEFPFDSLTGAGMAGRTPTNAPAGCTDPAQCGGDLFDLALSGMPQARYVRLRDATRYQGFDRLSAEVDAVGAIHQLTAAAPEATSGLVFRQSDNLLVATLPAPGTLWLMLPDGRLLGCWQGQDTISVALPAAPVLVAYRFVGQTGRTLTGFCMAR